jgi:Mitochondrial domain of unknown function (DUF1713)
LTLACAPICRGYRGRPRPAPRCRSGEGSACCPALVSIEGDLVGSVIKKRRKRMAKKKHRKLLRKTRVQRRNKK